MSSAKTSCGRRWRISTTTFSPVSNIPFDLRRPVGSRVTEILRDGKPVRDTDKLTLCLCDYRATGAGGFDFYKECPVVRLIQRDMIEMILDYFREHDLVWLPEDHGIRAIR